jgi:NTE family protein
VQTPDGPTAAVIVAAAADTAIDSSARSSFTAFDQTMSEWRTALVHWRCSLSPADREKYRLSPGWDCRDLKLFVGRINFDQLGARRAPTLNSIPTRFKLTKEDVDSLVTAGKELRANPVFREFLTSINGKPMTTASSPREWRRANSK